MADRLESTSKKSNGVQCMTVSLKILRGMGLWPNDNDTVYWAYTLFICFNTSIIATLFIIALFYSDLDGHDCIKNMANVLTIVPILITAISIIRNKDRYDNIINRMRSSFRCEGMAANEDITVFVRAIVTEEKNALTLYLLAVGATGYSYLLTPVVRLMLTKSDEDITIDLPSKMQPLFNRWDLDYMFQFVTVSFIVPTITALDAFSFAIVKYAANQFQVLNMLLKDVGGPFPTEDDLSGAFTPAQATVQHRTGSSSEDRSSDIYGKLEGDNSSELEKNLIDLVKMYQDILCNAQALADLLSPLMFTHYLTSSINVCLVAYETAMTDEISQMVAGVSHLMMLMGRIFLLSYFSSEIMDQSMNVGQMAYSCNWLSCSKDFKRMLMMMMCRAEKPVVMRTGWFGILSMETFAKLMQTAYTYYTLLKKLNI